MRSIDESIQFMQGNKQATINFITQSGDISLDNVETLYTTYLHSSAHQSSIEGFRAVVQDFRLGTTDKEKQDTLNKLKYEEIVSQEIIKRLA